MKKNYVKMNDNKKYLSLGNLFYNIKKISKGDSAVQNEMFCSLFNIKEINSTTVNNYCIGIRAISMQYKKIYFDLKSKYAVDKGVFINIVLSLISILDEQVYSLNNDSLNYINSNHNLEELCINLLNVAYEDENIDKEFTENLCKLIKDHNLYGAIVKILLYSVLENKQPIYTQDINIKINKKEFEDYIKVKLYEGVSYITSLKSLAKKNNVYACADLGSLEFDGIVSGYPNYESAFEYYMKATKKNHPKACWMIANMILTKKAEYNFEILWKCLNRAIELGSSAALNTIGKCYLLGINPDNKVDIEKAKEYFVESSNRGYAYAFNNLGMILEKENKYDEALRYYIISSDMGESWALNKMGEHYRKIGDFDMAYFYYKQSNECPVSERCEWAQYNLNKYFNVK